MPDPADTRFDGGSPWSLTDNLSTSGASHSLELPVARRPGVVVFDVNETLSDMEPLRERFVRVGAPPHRLDTWFAAVLRDGFALTAAGGYAAFREVAAAALRVLLADVEGGATDVDGAVDVVLGGLSVLEVHPDVPEGMRRLHEEGVRLVTLTNGSLSMSEGMFARAGVLDLLERRMSVSEVRPWKPAGEAYRYAAHRCGVAVDEMALVAVHPWDIDAARRAGLTTAWIDRKGRPYPPCFIAPNVYGSDLPAVAEELLPLGT